MITDKDREEAKNIYDSIKIPIEVSVGGLKIASVIQTGTILEKINGDDLADHIARIRAEAAKEARKEAADKAVEWVRSKGGYPYDERYEFDIDSETFADELRAAILKEAGK